MGLIKVFFFLIVGDVTFKVQARDCMQPPEIIFEPECHDDSNEVIGVSQ